MKVFFQILLAVFLVGCGYKPVSQVTKDMLGDDVYVHVVINKEEPKNSVWIADSVKEGIVSRLNRRLSDDKNAKTRINVAIQSMNLQAMLYDVDGYASLYKAVLRLEFNTVFEDGKVDKIVTTGEHDFTISRKVKDIRYADSVISEAERYNAIKEASREAFDEYIAAIAVKGHKK